MPQSATAYGDARYLLVETQSHSSWQRAENFLGRAHHWGLVTCLAAAALVG